MLTITPFLWFDTQAEEAMNYYASISRGRRPWRCTTRRAG
jgi:predicted 3-demethylubiquinone-9 3-methyltransferase (glyoxalase superfamily)